jgi:hypothetical protein
MRDAVLKEDVHGHMEFVRTLISFKIQGAGGMLGTSDKEMQ